MTTAQEAFQAWAIKASLVGSALLLALCIAVTLALFASRDRRSSRHE